MATQGDSTTPMASGAAQTGCLRGLLAPVSNATPILTRETEREHEMQTYEKCKVLWRTASSERNNAYADHLLDLVALLEASSVHHGLHAIDCTSSMGDGGPMFRFRDIQPLAPFRLHVRYRPAWCTIGTMSILERAMQQPSPGHAMLSSAEIHAFIPPGLHSSLVRDRLALAEKALAVDVKPTEDAMHQLVPGCEVPEHVQSITVAFNHKETQWLAAKWEVLDSASKDVRIAICDPLQNLKAGGDTIEQLRLAGTWMSLRPSLGWGKYDWMNCKVELMPFGSDHNNSVDTGFLTSQIVERLCGADQTRLAGDCDGVRLKALRVLHNATEPPPWSIMDSVDMLKLYASTRESAYRRGLKAGIAEGVKRTTIVQQQDQTEADQKGTSKRDEHSENTAAGHESRQGQLAPAPTEAANQNRRSAEHNTEQQSQRKHRQPTDHNKSKDGIIDVQGKRNRGKQFRGKQTQKETPRKQNRTKQAGLGCNESWPDQSEEAQEQSQPTAKLPEVAQPERIEPKQKQLNKTQQKQTPLELKRTKPNLVNSKRTELQRTQTKQAKHKQNQVIEIGDSQSDDVEVEDEHINDLDHTKESTLSATLQKDAARWSKVEVGILVTQRALGLQFQEISRLHLPSKSKASCQAKWHRLKLSSPGMIRRARKEAKAREKGPVNDSDDADDDGSLPGDNKGNERMAKSAKQPNLGKECASGPRADAIKLTPGEIALFTELMGPAGSNRSEVERLFVYLRAEDPNFSDHLRLFADYRAGLQYVHMYPVSSRLIRFPPAFALGMNDYVSSMPGNGGGKCCHYGGSIVWFANEGWDEGQKEEYSGQPAFQRYKLCDSISQYMWQGYVSVRAERSLGEYE